jgi:hypothetical protein
LPAHTHGAIEPRSTAGGAHRQAGSARLGGGVPDPSPLGGSARTCDQRSGGTSRTADLRVLVLGPGAAAASDEIRFEAMAPALAGLGLEIASWAPATGPDAPDEFEALEAALSWAGVVVLRRSYMTAHVCVECRARSFDRREIREHAAASGHAVVESPFAAIRPLVGLLEAEPDALGGRALVYDTDDDFFAADLAPDGEDWLERDLVARILALAALVTTATPVLAGRLERLTQAPVRVVRNALDPAWYAAPGRPAEPQTAGERAPGGRSEAGPPSDGPRVAYHGSAARLPDYELARPAVDALAAVSPGMRRIWLGSADDRVRGIVDEVRPWVAGVREFAAGLAAARPDIGLAPLRDTPYDRARSELHWLEYSLVGAATVASGFEGPGPYDPIRDGVDGLVARSGDDWRRCVRLLVTSPGAREEIAGRARERTLAEYSAAVRAEEWAGAYRWAAEHPGPGRRDGSRGR